MSNSPTTPFPLYLFPSIPFRRRKSSTTSTSPSSSPSSSPPQASPSYLANTPTSHLRCHKCLSDLIPTSSIISKGFTGRHGRAYLVAPPPPPPPSSIVSGFSAAMGWSKGELPNTLTHKPVPRQLVTGAHTVSDISCRLCGCVLGWKYVGAEEDSQKYKVGKFILETKRVVKGVGWEDGCGSGSGSRGDVGEEDDHEEGLGRVARGGGKDGDEEDKDIQFDSQDEDECEDLFSGVWSPQLARRRRRRKGTAFGRGA